MWLFTCVIISDYVSVFNKETTILVAQVLAAVSSVETYCLNISPVNM